MSLLRGITSTPAMEGSVLFFRPDENHCDLYWPGSGGGHGVSDFGLGLALQGGDSCAATDQGASHGRNHSLSGTRIRQGVVNGLTVCQSGACGPLLCKGRLAKGCFYCSNRLLKRIAFRWWKRSLHPLAHGHRCCTEACCLRILPLCIESSSKAFQAPGNKGRTVKGPEDDQALPVARFGQRVVVLLRGQVTQQRREQGDMKGRAYGPYDRQGFFVQCSGTHKVSPHPR